MKVFSRKIVALMLVCFLLLDKSSFVSGSNDGLYWLAGAAVGAGAAYFVFPPAIGIVGFTKAGIAAGSYAASMMSSAAVANGGAVAAGSAVATLQSVGAAGLSYGAVLTSGVAGGAAGKVISMLKEED